MFYGLVGIPAGDADKPIAIERLNPPRNLTAYGDHRQPTGGTIARSGRRSSSESPESSPNDEEVRAAELSFLLRSGKKKHIMR
jgi:hypothetical protein